MFFAFLTLRNPIILLAGFPDSPLDITYNYTSSYWFCPRHGTNEWTFFHWWRLLFPRTLCALELSRLIYDNSTDTVQSPPGISFSPHSFGNVHSLNKFVRMPFGFDFLAVLGEITRSLENKGLVANESLFGAPYDWRFGVYQPPYFWRDFQSLIETAFERNNDQKVIVFGFSLGTLVIHRFLTEIVSNEWRSKYIEKICLMAPPFSGIAIVPELEYLGRFEGKFVGKVWPKLFTKTLRTWPAIHTFLPNAILWKDEVVLETETENVTADKFVDFLIEKAGFEEEEKKILLASVNFSKSLPADPGVKSDIIFNSGLKTKLGINLRTGKKLKQREMDPRVHWVLNGSVNIGNKCRVQNWQNKHWLMLS
jgi:pimeloyl-ACP methyl ester carboxylesterase